MDKERKGKLTWPWWKKLIVGTGLSAITIAGGMLGLEGILRATTPDHRAIFTKIKAEEGEFIVPNPDYRDGDNNYLSATLKGKKIPIKEDKRLFVMLGESTMAGNALNINDGEKNGSPGDMAFHIVQENITHKNKIEKVNLAVIGHGFRTARRLIEDIRKNGRDKNVAFVVYNANNEELPYEVSKDLAESKEVFPRLTNTLSRSRLIEKSKELIGKYFIKNKEKDEEIFPMDSAKEDIIRESIKRDLQAMIEEVGKYRNTHLYLCTTISNPCMPPIRDNTPLKMNNGDLEKFDQRFKHGLKLINQEKFMESLDVWEDLMKQGSNSPMVYYLAGTAYQRIGQNEKAWTLYNLAINNDQEPIRAKEETTELIRRTSWDNKRVTLIDISKLIGNNVIQERKFFDGMHPTAETAYYEIAVPIAKSILEVEYNLQPSEIVIPTLEEYKRHHPLSENFADLCGASFHIAIHKKNKARYFFEKTDKTKKESLFRSLVEVLILTEEERVLSAIEKISSLKINFPELEIFDFLHSMGEMAHLIEREIDIYNTLIPYSEKKIFWDGRTYEQRFFDNRGYTELTHNESVTETPPHTATHIFSAGRESIIPIMPQEDCSITYNDLADRLDTSRLLNYSEWCDIIIGEKSQKSENLAPLDRLQLSLINYLNRMSKSREQITAHINANMPWREYVAPDKSTGGKPAIIELKPGQLNIIQDIDPNKAYEGVHYRFVIDIPKSSYDAESAVTLETKLDK